MNILKQLIWLLLTVILLACSGWFFTHSKKTNLLDADRLSSTADTSISQLTVRQFSPEGQLMHFLTTPLMHHIPKGDVNILQMPHIIISQVGQPAWDIRAIKAKSFDKNQRIVFTKNVIVHQKAGGKTQESTLTTEKIVYFPKEKKATSDLLVTYEQPGNFMQSKGMNAYLDEKRVELLHQARGSYVPAKG
ncbi:MAG: LPS export ABC transporter periplasmic protein LptC [Legionellales bacterium]